MLTKLVVPLDGSQFSESVLGPAQILAERLGATLTLLTARARRTLGSMPLGYLEERQRVVDRPAETVHVADRDAPQAIVLAGEEPGTLVCMATHGHGGIGRAVLGSVAEAVIWESRSPVLLVGPALSRGWSLPDAPVVLLGIDGSEHSQAATPAAADLALAVGADVRVLEVVRPPDVVAVSRFRTADVDLLENTVQQLDERGVRATYEVVDGLDAAEVIVTDAVESSASFIVLATHGRTGLARVALGSIAMRVVHLSPCPVLVVRPHALHTPSA